MLDDYATKLDRHVDVNGGKLFGMKSYDYHVFIEHLLLIALIGYLKILWSLIIELNQFLGDCALQHQRRVM